MFKKINEKELLEEEMYIKKEKEEKKIKKKRLKILNENKTI